MHRLLVLYPPPSDPDHFRSYYEATHLPLAAKLPGLRGYRYSFDVATAEGESPYYCVFEADFDDAAAYRAAMATPEGHAVRADVPNYATGGAAWDTVGTPGESATYRGTWTFDTEGLTQSQIDALQGSRVSVDLVWELQSDDA